MLYGFLSGEEEEMVGVSGGGGLGGSNLTSIKLTCIRRMEVVRSLFKRSSSVTSTGEPCFWFGGNFFFFFFK